MSLYRTSMLALNVLQNVQQAQTNTRLQSLVNFEQVKQEQNQAVSAIRDVLFNLSQGLRSSDATLPARLFVALTFEEWCAMVGVGTGSFDDLRDKEFFNETGRAAKETIATAKAQLSPEDFTTVQLLVSVPAQARLLDAVQAWENALAGMKGGPLIWNGFSFVFVGPFLCFVVATFIAVVFGVLGGQRGASPVATVWFVIIAGFASVSAASWRRRKAAELMAIVSPYGGYVTSHARRAGVAAIADEHRQAITHPWAPLADGWAKAKGRGIRPAHARFSRCRPLTSLCGLGSFCWRPLSLDCNDRHGCLGALPRLRRDV